jgi:hypothetical protein
MTSRGVSFMLESFCQMATRRTSDGNDGYRGTMEVVWDDLRVKSLCARYGVQWMERGSKGSERPAEEVTVDLNKPSDGFKAVRKAWYGSEKGSRGVGTGSGSEE